MATTFNKSKLSVNLNDTQKERSYSLSNVRTIENTQQKKTLPTGAYLAELRKIAKVMTLGNPQVNVQCCKYLILTAVAIEMIETSA